MDNNELFVQVLAAMQEQTEILTKMVDSKFAGVQEEIQSAEARISLKVENEVSRKIEALFDGYKLTHEKQWELERETERLKEQLGDLETRLAVLEKKVSA